MMTVCDTDTHSHHFGLLNVTVGFTDDLFLQKTTTDVTHSRKGGVKERRKKLKLQEREATA